MKVTVIDRLEAPSPPTGGWSLLTAAVLGLRPGRVAKITPTEGENITGIRLRLWRIARMWERPIGVWVHEGVVYVELAR